MPASIREFLIERLERMMSGGARDPQSAVEHLPASMPAGSVVSLADRGPFGWLLDARLDRIDARIALEVCEDSRMSGPRHYRVWEDGSVEELPTERQSIVFGPDCSDEERERLEQEYFAHNRAIHDLLVERGFRRPDGR